MIKGIEDLRYNFAMQKEKYSEIAKNISEEDKYSLIEEILEKDLWSYFQIITEILYDLAKPNETYLDILEKTYLKVKNDMASAPFFDMLIGLGQKKKDIGIKIYDKIRKESNNEELKDALGFILGGYSMNDNTILCKLIEDKKLAYPDTITILKAIMIKGERTNEISKEEYEFLDFVSQSDDERFLRELMNLYRFLYHINKTYFYSKIKSLMGKKKSGINAMIWIFNEKLKLSNTQLLELAELTKDCDEYAIGELMSALTHNKSDYSPQEIKQISELFIYWINKDLEFKVRFFDYSIEELSKKNIGFLEYFLDNYKKIGVIGKESLNYNFLFPRIFERLSRSLDDKITINKLLKSNIFENDSKLFYNLSDKIIGKIYQIEDKKEALKSFLNLAKKIQGIAEQEDFINESKRELERYNFDCLVDYIKELLEQLIYRKRNFDFKKIYENLSKYSKLESVLKSKLKELEKNKRYSPIFWLCSWQEDEGLKKAYLQEMENFLIYSEKVDNEKNKNDNQRSLLAYLENEKGFWNTFSEIIFSNKFIPNNNYVLEPKIPNKEENYADLLVRLNDKKMFFEVTNPETNRNVNLDNGAVGVRNKLRDIIQNKTNQYKSKKTIDEINTGERSDQFFVVVNRGSSLIDEYEIENCFYGSLGVQYYVNTGGGDTPLPPSKTIRGDDAIVKNKDFITGLVYFKPQLVNKNGEIKFILVGDIMQNPEAKNKMTSEDYKKLKRIIFG